MGNDLRRPNEATADQLLFRYLTALEGGDLDAVEAVLTAALDDPALDRLIAEANRELHDEAGLSPLAEDADRVRSLLRQTIPSAFREEGEPLPVTVGEVAAKLRQDGRLSKPDRALGQRLATDDRPVPASVDRAALGHLREAIGDGSEAFWRRFRDAAIMAWLGRGHQRTQLAATRVAKARALGMASPAPRQSWIGRSELPAVDPVEAARRAYAAAGRDQDRAESAVTPLDDLIAAHPIRHEEVPGLTYRRAAEFLAKETGQLIGVPERQPGDLAGFLFCLIEGETLIGCILVKGDDRIERRRFSAAHEFGHYVQHFQPLLARAQAETGTALLWEGLTYAADDALPSGTIEEAVTLPAVGPESVLLGGDRREAEANRFAAELLMPRAACRAAIERHARRFGTATPVRLLASEFLVSQEAMRRRLSDLGLLDAVAGQSEEG